MRCRPIAYLLILALFALGCQSDPGKSAGTGDQRPTDAAKSDGKPVAFLDGKRLTRDQLYAVMVEARGGQALSEIILDRAIPRLLAEEGFELTPADLDTEREQLLASLSRDPDEAARLLKQMRLRRGLGDLRFASLLKRNAGLRKLVSKQGVKISPQAVRNAYQIRYGKRYRVRLITTEGLGPLAQARKAVAGGASFTDQAIAVSTDLSASRGGLLAPISPADDTYPLALRRALPGLSMKSRATRLSPLIALPEGYALLWLEEVLDEKPPPFETVQAELRRALRLESERVLMQRLARTLIEQANLIVLDRALDAAWKQQRKTILDP